MKGRDVKMSDYRGKVVVLNFWTRTCGPCLKEMPSIAELAKMLEPMKDVVVLAVSIDDGPDDVKDTLTGVLREPPPFSILFDPDGRNVVYGKFGTRLFPETWIIDKRGVVRARFDGGRDWRTPRSSSSSTTSAAAATARCKRTRRSIAAASRRGASRAAHRRMELVQVRTSTRSRSSQSTIVRRPSTITPSLEVRSHRAREHEALDVAADATSSSGPARGRRARRPAR